MPDFVTVYVLAYNRPDYLRQCLQSIAGQTCRRFRVVVLDNASAMDLRPVVEQFRNFALDYVRHPRNIGAIGNSRHAWRDAKTTPYFVIFHDDDLMHPEFLERGIDTFMRLGDIAWAGSQSLNFKHQPPPFQALDSADPMILNAAELAYRLMTRRSNVTFSSVVYRSDLTDGVDLEELFDLHSVIFDRPLLFALAQERPCVLSPLPLVFYRVHPAQGSRNAPLNEDNLLALFTTYRQVLQPLWNDRVEREFFAWSGFHIPDGYQRLADSKRSPFAEYLRKARTLGVYRDRWLSRYLAGAIRHFGGRLKSVPRKLGELMFLIRQRRSPAE